MIHIVHVRRAPFTIYIGRKCAEFVMSKWHNPFSRGTRFDNIRDFEIYARRELWHMLAELDGETLGCWCHPKACHGDVLKRLRQEQLDAKVETLHAEHSGVQPTLGASD